MGILWNKKCNKCGVTLSLKQRYICTNCQILEEQKNHNKFIQNNLRQTQSLQRQNANRQKRQQEKEDAQYLAEQSLIEAEQEQEDAQYLAEQALIEAEQEAQRVQILKKNLEVHKNQLRALPSQRTYDCFYCKNQNVMVEHLDWEASTYLYNQKIQYTLPACTLCGVKCIDLPKKEKFLFKDYLFVLLLSPAIVFIKFLLWLSIIIWIFIDISFLEILYKAIAASIVIGSIWCLLEGNVKTDISDRTPHFIPENYGYNSPFFKTSIGYNSKLTWSFEEVPKRKKWFIFGQSVIIGKKDKNNEFSNLQKTISQTNFHPYATGGAQIWRGHKWILIKFLPIFIFLLFLIFLVIGIFHQNIEEIIGRAGGAFLFIVSCIFAIYLSYKFSNPNSTHYTKEDYYLRK